MRWTNNVINPQCFDSTTGEASVEMEGTSRFDKYFSPARVSKSRFTCLSVKRLHLLECQNTFHLLKSVEILFTCLSVKIRISCSSVKIQWQWRVNVYSNSGDVTLTMAVSSKYYVYPHNSEQFPTVGILYIIKLSTSLLNFVIWIYPLSS